MEAIQLKLWHFSVNFCPSLPHRRPELRVDLCALESAASKTTQVTCSPH